MRDFLDFAFRNFLDGFYEDKIEDLREQIILKKDSYYFDWTASGLASSLVENRIREILPFYANTHSSSSTHAMLIQELYQESKKNIRKSLALDDDFAVISCGSGSTSAIKKFQELLGIYIPPATKKIVEVKKDLLPLVVVGAFEHHSNEISFREGLCEVYRVRLLENFDFDLEDFERVLEQNKHRKIIFSCNLISNVTGNIAPYKEMVEIARKYSCIIAFDMATSSPDLIIDCNYFDACFLSPHKLMGGVGGSGILCVRKTLIDTSKAPTFAGGGVVSYVDRKTQIYLNDEELREEAGTPPILQLFRSSLAYKLRDEVGIDFISQRKKVLMRLLMQELQTIKDIVIYGKTEHFGVVSFNIFGISPFDLAYFLSKHYKIQTRAGCSCAGPYGHDLLKLQDNVYRGEKNPYGWLRISVHYTHTLQDIKYLSQALRKAIDILNPGLYDTMPQ
ncbi:MULTISPECIES: aminotransferase class V-fold PLP-dependent enzyme [unclassified Helicobacter]|uniref:aminotransferase class V-fold PLP-dependent enzyme n=1 Tax=unclassified Helicobacter TaxID=2593540 RepID=UPI000CF11B1F|nr:MULTISPECIES: aminotransferase class V-fold PLP-dependent enzyme [unclassified Helicobacter]